jgi:hypothetical protein
LTEWAIEVYQKTGNKPEIHMIENYWSSDMGKFELVADKFFCAGYGSVQFQGAQSTVLLSDMLSEFDEAFIVAILHNSFERWVQEGKIIAEGREVDSKKLVKTKWMNTGAAAKKYEGWVKEGVEFFNNQVQELQIVWKTAVSKGMEEEYLQKKGHGREAERSSEEIIPSKCAEWVGCC